MNNKKNSIITIVIGLLFAGIFTFVYINSEKKFKSFDKTTEATKIEENCEEEFEDGETKQTCYPKYTYEVEDKEYICTSKTGSNTVNTKKSLVYYDSKDPEKCMTEFDSKNNKFSLIGTALGVIVTIVGIISLFKKENQNEEE